MSLTIRCHGSRPLNIDIMNLWLTQRFFPVLYLWFYAVASFGFSTVLFLGLPTMIGIISLGIFASLIMLALLLYRTCAFSRSLIGSLTFLAFFGISLWASRSSFGTQDIAHIYYLSLGITACWILNFPKLKKLIGQWFFPWVGFLFLSPIYLRWRGINSGNSYLTYCLSLLIITGLGLHWLMKEARDIEVRGRKGEGDRSEQ